MRGNPIRIRLLKHRATDLLMAISDDLPGLVLHGRSEQEIEEKLPQAIKELLRAAGQNVDTVEIVKDQLSTNYFPPAFIANTHLHPQT